MAVYVVAARRTLRSRSRRVELHHLPTGTVAAYDHSEESLERHLTRAERDRRRGPRRGGCGERLGARAEDAAVGDADAIEAIDAHFPPTTGHVVLLVRLPPLVPEGREASSEITPWTGLADSQ